MKFEKSELFWIIFDQLLPEILKNKKTTTVIIVNKIISIQGAAQSEFFTYLFRYAILPTRAFGSGHLGCKLR